MSDPVLTRSTVASFRSGDPSAFEAVVKAHSSLVRAIVGRYFRQVFEQEEAIQEVWLQILRQRESFDVERWEQLDRWLSVVAKRRCIDIARQKVRRPPTQDLDAMEPAPAATMQAGQDVGVERSQLLEALEDFKSRLDTQWREFFDLHFVGGRTHPETARELGVTVARSKYMKRVLVARSKKSPALMNALGRPRGAAGGHGDAS